MAQDRWWIHQRGKSLYSTQTLLKKMCMAKTCKKMSIYDDIWWYMSIYVNMVQDWTYNKFHSTAWKCIICSNPCTGTIWNIKEPLTPSSNSPFWGEGRWLYGRSWRCAHSKTKVPAGAEANACPTSVAPAISSANESASDLPRFAPICLLLYHNLHHKVLDTTADTTVSNSHKTGRKHIHLCCPPYNS